MLLAILEAVISGIVLEVIFNAWHKRHQILEIIQQRETQPQAAIKAAPEEVPSEPQAPPKPAVTASATTTPASSNLQSLFKQLRPFRMIARVFVASLGGFIIGGLVAGIVEAETAREIALGSGESFLYIGVPMALTWLLLWSFGPLKRGAWD